MTDDPKRQFSDGKWLALAEFVKSLPRAGVRALAAARAVEVIFADPRDDAEAFAEAIKPLIPAIMAAQRLGEHLPHSKGHLPQSKRRRELRTTDEYSVIIGREMAPDELDRLQHIMGDTNEIILVVAENTPPDAFSQVDEDLRADLARRLRSILNALTAPTPA
ncbi:MAG: hypothetical protein AB7F96_15390 [Beijerinckiaceae bacterium]